MPCISILTGSYHSSHDHLLEAYESIRQQVLPAGWEYEWCIQGDDPNDPPLPQRILDDEHVFFMTNPCQLGIGTTRNYALVRSKGELIRPLDHDDVLLPHALANAIADLTNAPAAALQFTPVIIFADGEQHDGGVQFTYQPGILPAGALDVAWRQGESLGLATMSVTLRREHLLCFGGWPAVYRWEDVHLAIGLGAQYPTVYNPEPSMLYRRHEHNVTSTRIPTLRPLNAELLHQIIAARRILQGEEHERPYPILPPTADVLFDPSSDTV